MTMPNTHKTTSYARWLLAMKKAQAEAELLRSLLPDRRNYHLIAVTKVRRLSELSQNLPFTKYDFYDLYQKTFENNISQKREQEIKVKNKCFLPVRTIEN